MTARLAPPGRLARLWRRLRREDGSASLEFVLVFPLFVAVLAASIEAGVFMTRQVMVERALDLAVRDLRLGRLDPPEIAELRRRICEQTIMVPQCEAEMMIELRPVDVVTWQGLDDPARCINRDADIEPVNSFSEGAQNELMIVRACVLANAMFPLTGLGLALEREPGSGYRLAAKSVFVNEPR